MVCLLHMHVPAIATRAVDRSRRFGSAALAIGWVAAAGAALADTASESGPRVPGVASEVYVTGMTFVVSRPGQRDLVLEAPRATLHPETNKAELFAWLEEGAHLYVCGDATSMAKDVDLTLQRIAAEQGRDPEAWIEALRRDHRYSRDVY